MPIKEMKMQVVVVIVLALISLPSLGQSDLDRLMYDAYLSEKNTKEKWIKIVEQQRKISDANPASKNELYNLALAYFGLLNSTLRDEDEDLFDMYVDETEEVCERLISEDKNWAEPKALLSATYGLTMAYTPLKGLVLGSKSNSLIEQALQDDPNSPLTWAVYANSKLQTPEMWGGDIDKAVSSYEKTIILFERDQDSIRSNWIYLNSLASMGIAYEKQGSVNKAIGIYNKALEFEPDFGWVRSQLLPAANKKSSK